ncbi:hypothetical protein GQ55_4G369600 [Panicum hallii var. hallii]|uniref:Membrane protein of ER body-like protein n=1 Tax=Panicum hallii var. hallii TaxID=1504633 RepID=A0A2T7E437_9POAL|nr:hypothetical protein GQ55_4G369600 [Panicum hallii var. hallii]
MMEVEKPWEGVQQQPAMDDEAEEAAAAAGGLRTREMKKKMAGPAYAGDNVGDVVVVEELLKAAAVAAAAEEEDKSVFFDPAEVSDHATEEDEVTEVVQVDGQKENSNETSIAEGKGTEEEENVNDQETNHISSNGKLENGSHSNGVHEISRGTETMTVAVGEAQPLKLIAAIGESKNVLPNWSGVLDISNGSTSTTEVREIEVEKDENGTKDKVNIEEYDLVKILDEQETHDLYCPNCKSCITRRVILKKRKRTARQAKREEPPKRPQLEEPSAIVSDQTSVESHDQESPEVFRCLSCFTFFIPTGCRFNIFRIFEWRDANQQVQVQDPAVSQGTSEHCGSWLLSCFQTVDSPKKSTDAVGEAEQVKKPLVAGSSSTVQTTTGKYEEEIKQPFSESHGTASSSVAVHTSSSSQSETGLFTQTGHVVTEQRGGAHQEQIPPSKPADDMINGVHKQDIQGNTTGAPGKNSFFNPELKVPAKFLPGVNNLTGEKPTPVIPQPSQSPHVVVPVPEATVSETPVRPAPSDQRDEWDILKAIVYGGLVESITSLSVVSAAAASGAKTLDIFILGIANLIGGLPVIYHNIADLRNTGDVAESSEQVGHYWLELGRRRKYQLHMVVAILSYILFGLLPPVIYGLSFRMSDNRENKMMAVAAASLMCIGLLAIAKAHVKRRRTYITTLLYYLSIGFSSSGLSYVTGVLITRLLAHFGLIDQGGASALAPPSLLFPQAMGADAATWASY